VLNIGPSELIWELLDIEKVIIKPEENVYNLRNGRHVYLIDKAARYIEKNYRQELTLEEVARLIYYSPCHFSHVFKQIKSCSFSKYLTHVRIEQAKSLLTSTDFQISQIAKLVGYRDVRYFCTVFKQNTNSTPTNFRYKHLMNKFKEPRSSEGTPG